MNRTTSNALGQIVRQNAPRADKFLCKIKAINYINRRLQVTARGYSGPRRVAAQVGVDLGNTDRPRVFPGDVALVERQSDGKWLCTSITHKIKCATGAAGSEVDVNTSSSYEVDGFGTTITPLDLFIPPIEALGDLWVQGDAPPDAGTYLCGIPPCSDCAPDGYQPGMAPIISSEGESTCWVWGFRNSVCGLHLRTQTGIASYPSAGATPNDIVVAVNGRYAYVAYVGDPLTLSPALLLTYDLTDPRAPVLTDQQDIDSPVADSTLVYLGIATSEDDLWVYGIVDDESSGLTSTNIMVRYDVSTRTAPSKISDWETRFFNDFVVYRHYDSESQTFTGQPYLVGFNWDVNDEAAEFTELIVEDGWLGGEVQTLSGYNFGKGGFSSSGIYACQAVICDNVALMPIWEGPGDTTATRRMLAVDLSGVPDDPITALWEDENVEQPEVHLGQNRAFAREYVGGFKLYTQVDVDNTSAYVGGSPDPFPTEDAEVRPWGYFLNENCLFRVDNLADQAWVQDVSDAENPVLLDVQNTGFPTQGRGDGRFSDGDLDAANGRRVYLCHVGKGSDWATYLTVYSNY